MPSGSVDASIRYQFLKNKAADITASISDIFRTRYSDVVTMTDYSDEEDRRIMRLAADGAEPQVDRGRGLR